MTILPQRTAIFLFSFRTIKQILKPRDRIDILMTKLLQSNLEYKRKMINITLGIRGAFGLSNLQRDYRKAHPEAESQYSVTSLGSVYTVSYIRESKGGENIKTSHRLVRNPISCNRQLCEVKCLDCPAVSVCAHTYVCDCKQYGFRNFCRHSHVVAMSQSVSAPSLDHGYVCLDDDEPSLWSPGEVIQVF